MPNNLKIDCTYLDDTEIYELILQGRIQNFPSGFWVNRSVEEAKAVAIKLLKYLIDERLKLNKEEVKKEISKAFITKYKLHTASKLFGRSAIRYVLSAYPEAQYQPWQFINDKVPRGYWKSRSNRINALKYVFQEELQWEIEVIKEKLNWDIIKEYRLYTLHTYYPNLYNICDVLYPGLIKPWELRQSEVNDYFWDDKNNRKNAVQWLLKSKLIISHPYKLKKEHFSEYGLSALLNKYNCSVKNALNEAFERSAE